MNTSSDQSIRPTKKQRELLSFIENFIKEHGYSPSYREIMNGLNYTSVATVSLHVSNLIRRGHLRKRDRSARSLEVVASTDGSLEPAATRPSEEQWLLDKVEQCFRAADAESPQAVMDDLKTLIAALKIFGLNEEAEAYALRLADLDIKQA